MAPAAQRQCPPGWPPVLALTACLALAVAPRPAQAAVKVNYDLDTDSRGSRLMTPVTGKLLGRTFYFEIPHDPVGVLFMAHGCVHGASDFWPSSAACPECSGLPEEMSHTKQALRRGYAVLAVDSKNREPTNRCFTYPEDKWGVKYIIENWTRQYNLQALPIFGLGISAGASFVLRLPKITRINGIVSEVLGVTYETFPVEGLGSTYPPTIFIDMQRDRTMTARIADSMQKLSEWNVSCTKIAVDPRPVLSSFFSDRSEFISLELSRKIVRGLHKIGMIDVDGYVTQDPRYTTKPWKEQLAAAMGKDAPQPESVKKAGPASDWALLGEQMNLAFAMHEIIGDHLTASLAWLESGGTVSIDVLERELQVQKQTARLQAERDVTPRLQDDEALKQAAEQVEQQLATTAGKHDNWGDLYAAYVEWLKSNPAGDLTFPAWRASEVAGRFRYKDPVQAAQEAAMAHTVAAAATRGQPGQEQAAGRAQGLGALAQHTAL